VFCCPLKLWVKPSSKPRTKTDLGDLAGYFLAALALCGSPGPATLSMAAAGAAFSVKAALRFYFGLWTGVAIVASLVASGILAAVTAIPHAGQVLTAIAIIYMVWLAWKIANAPPVQQPGSTDKAPGYFSGIVLNLTNPKAYASFTAVFAGFDLLPGDAIASSILEVLVLTGLAGAFNLAWLLAGNALQRFFQDEKTSRRINISFAILLLASVAVAFLI